MIAIHQSKPIFAATRCQFFNTARSSSVDARQGVTDEGIALQGGSAGARDEATAATGTSVAVKDEATAQGGYGNINTLLGESGGASVAGYGATGAATDSGIALAGYGSTNVVGGANIHGANQGTIVFNDTSQLGAITETFADVVRQVSESRDNDADNYARLVAERNEQAADAESGGALTAGKLLLWVVGIGAAVVLGAAALFAKKW